MVDEHPSEPTPPAPTAWPISWIAWPVGIIAGLSLAYFSLIWAVDQFITTEDERRAERLDQLQAEVFDLRLREAETLDDMQTDDCSSQTFSVETRLRFAGTQEEVFAFYRERLFDRGWIETGPVSNGDATLHFRKQYSWGYGFASVDARGEVVAVEVGFNC